MEGYRIKNFFGYKFFWNNILLLIIDVKCVDVGVFVYNIVLMLSNGLVNERCWKFYKI